MPIFHLTEANAVMILFILAPVALLATTVFYKMINRTPHTYKTATTITSAGTRSHLVKTTAQAALESEYEARMIALRSLYSLTK